MQSAAGDFEKAQSSWCSYWEAIGPRPTIIYIIIFPCMHNYVFR